MKRLEQLAFDNMSIKYLPIDKSSDYLVQRNVSNACFSLVKPTRVIEPKLLLYSIDCLNLLDIDNNEINRQDFAEYFSGNKHFIGADYAAHTYCGHQFGYFSGQLGDGATMYIGEIVNNKNERWELQFKGAGKTPYSRTADGRKVLRSSLREFLCSEHMNALGVPTTRAGTLVISNTMVERDQFYNGNIEQEHATIITRVAPTFLRFGSFEICKETDSMTGRAGPSHKNPKILEQLLRFTVQSYFSNLFDGDKIDESKHNINEIYLNFFKQIVISTAKLVAKWQCVGFCHGVLNTDNMSILGITIDYGPFGFMEYYDPNYICNASDHDGRYTYIKQPEICRWNCYKLAEALALFIPLEKSKSIIEKYYDQTFEKYYYDEMKCKLGLMKSQSNDKELIDSLFKTMENTRADFTNTFQNLYKFAQPNMSITSNIEFITSKCQTIAELRASLKPTIPLQQLRMLVQLVEENPMIIQQVPHLTRELHNIHKLQDLQNIKQSDFDERNKKEWCNWLQQYQGRLKLEHDIDYEERVQLMNSFNPKFILRNYIAQYAIDKAKEGDQASLSKIFDILTHPFTKNNLNANISEQKENVVINKNDDDHIKNNIFNNRPDWALSLHVT